MQWGIEPLPLHELMEQSEGVCVQLAYFPRYRGLIGERVLGFAKQGQVVVSIAHSAVFDDVALAEALNSGRILAAWFDSLEPGLLEAGRALANAPGLQVTPPPCQHHPRIAHARGLGRGAAHRRAAEHAARSDAGVPLYRASRAA